MPYSCEQIVFTARGSIVLHCILSVLPECGPVGITGAVSVNCVLICFSYEDSINVYNFIARVAYRLA